jgi:hypothetical protein
VERIWVRIIGKDGCHLCDDAQTVVESVVAQYTNVSIEHALLVDNPEWALNYADKIPVIHVGGDEVGYWRISSERLVAELDSRGGIPAAADSEYK